jgi:predicted amidophosphoribosyltransferase
MLANALVHFLSPLITEDAVLVPVPISHGRRSDSWNAFVGLVARELPRLIVLPLLRRKKIKSTRASVAQLRGEIVRQEYSVVEDLLLRVEDRNLYVLDDNVTTGHTIVYCCKLLAQTLSRQPVPVCFDRTVSPRILQRCTPVQNLSCEYQQPKDTNG